MKGSLAAMIYAVGNLDRGELRGRVAVSATVSEEFVEGGALKSVVEALRPDFVVIGEATELNLNRGGRGRAEIQLKTFGRSAHSSSPQAGRCAVTDMIRVIQAIQDKPAPVDAVLGPGSIVLTDIISEPHPGHSVIPYRCDVTYDRRLLPADSKESLLNELKSLPGLADIEYSVALADMEERTYSGSLLKGEKFFPAWVFPETHPFVQSALRGLKSAGLNPQVGAYRFCTNAAYCAGVAGIPTVGFGIGREEDAHIVDESIAVADLLTAAKGYQGIIYSTLEV
jgi:putative selenium metabolism hydrolase